jgi:hypothetical protein
VPVELLLCVTKLGRFDGSTGSAGFGVEKKEDTLALEIIQGDKCVVIRFETEAGSFGAYFEHPYTSMVKARHARKASGLKA